MITFKSLGRKGNLGNQLFHIASTIGIAKVNGHEFVFSKWRYNIYFKYQLPIDEKEIDFKQIIEKSYSFHKWDLGCDNYDINGALQSEKYFDIPLTKQIFKIKGEFLDSLLIRFNYLFERKTIFISVRRGDFVYHPHYYQLSYQYYFLALKEYFPDWKERNLIFMSDDIDYCKFHFSFLKNAVFLENLSAIEQLAISSQGQDFIISNSTFSWWSAWLSEKDNSKIIRPLKNFRGEFAKLHDDKDFFPERWISFDYRKRKIGLEDLGLIIRGSSFQIFNVFKFCLTEVVSVTKKVINKVFS